MEKAPDPFSLAQPPPDVIPRPALAATARPWAPLLESLVRCPSCGASLRIDPAPACGTCGWTGHVVDGIPDFVEAGTLGASHHAEVEAQTAAVDAYYENELRLTCHWDRLSSDDIAERLDWPTGVALDLGCGTGTAGAGLVRHGMRVVGADLSPPCLAVAARRLDAVVRVDAAKLPFADASFDALVARGALHHMKDPHAVMQEVRRVLKPGAPALFLDPREYAWLEPIKDRLRASDDSFTHDHHAYDPAAYEALIGSALRVDKAWSEHPLAILAAHGLDLIPMPGFIRRRPLTRALLGIDRALNQTPLGALGHLLVVRATRV